MESSQNYPIFLNQTNQNGTICTTLLLYNPTIPQFSIIPNLKSFEYFQELLNSHRIVKFMVDVNFEDCFQNVIAAFLDNNNIFGYVVLQYNKTLNEIYPPISYCQYSISPPQVICLRGKIHQYGPHLENSPSNLLYIGRNLNMGGWRLPSSKWANPFSVKQYGREGALQKYREYILTTPSLLHSLPELNNKILACWCHPEPCHGHILTELYSTFVQ